MTEDGFPCGRREALSGESALVRTLGRETRSSLFDAAARLFVPDILLSSGEISALAAASSAAVGRSVGGAVFTVGRYAVRADFLRPLADGGYELILVCEMARVHGRQIRTAALAAVFAEECGFPVRKLTAAGVNPDYVRGEEIDPEGLIVLTDVTGEAERYVKEFRGELARRMNGETDGGAVLSESCFTGADCPYVKRCAGELPFPSVFDVFGMSGKEILRNYEKGILSYAQLTENGVLNAAEERQLRMTGAGYGEEYDAEELGRWLGQRKGPVCFLDFEGIASAVPPFPGMKPFETLPFAFSFHTEAGECSVFLGEPGEDPRRKMAEALISLIPAPGTVFAYDKNYENSVLKLLAARFPEYRGRLEAIRLALVDLSVPFRSGWYYASGMNGSVSLKAVAPAMFPVDAALSYDSLNGVKNGSDAVEAYRLMTSMTEEEREAARRELTAYSAMDTYTMLRMYRKLKELAN
ncbi:MAG: DUF2779 domain-containing protein [Lachnospiraceae bacterium]|nr:DUF2779 domain-containing protein [Lachnospiraceae bacterium]